MHVKGSQWYTVNYNYFAFSTDLSASTDTLSVPDEFKHVVIDGAMYHTYMFRDNPQQATITKQKFDEVNLNKYYNFIEKYKDYDIYLATDDYRIQEIFKKKYENRLFYFEKLDNKFKHHSRTTSNESTFIDLFMCYCYSLFICLYHYYFLYSVLSCFIYLCIYVFLYLYMYLFVSFFIFVFIY